MSQTLKMPNGAKVIVDRIFADDGEPAMVGNVGGIRTLLKDGRAALPRVAMLGKAFFFLDANRTPVKTLDDIKVIPETSPHRKAAEEFVTLAQQGGKKAEQVIKTAKPAPQRRTRFIKNFGGKRGLEKAMDFASSGRRPDDLEEALPPAQG